MTLKNIGIESLKQSPTNTKVRNEGKGFEELIASIKEKGVLMPILVRVVPGGKAIYEVIAGNRRFQAAKEAGLKEVPAKIVEMSDTEAREAQIVENLQREDIHPIDEGSAYRRLIETSRPIYKVGDVALKVGKSETYVKQRLALTNLSEKCAKAFRAGKMSITFAVILSRLEDEKMQNEAWNVNEWKDVDRLKEWIQNKIYANLNNKPWAKDVKLSEMVGDSKTSNLFGDKSLGNDPVLYAEHMAAFIEIKIREAKEKGQKMVKICTMYGKPDLKGVLAKESYKILSSKEDKESAKELIKGIIAEGSDLGKIYTVSTDPKDLVEDRIGSSAYKLSKKEIAEKKAARLKEETDKKKRNDDLAKALNKITWPLSEKHLNVLVDLVFGRFGFSYIGPVASRHGIKAIKKEMNGYTQRDLETPLREYVDGLVYADKMKFIFEVALETSSQDEYKKL